MKIYAMTFKGCNKQKNEDRLLINNHILSEGYYECECGNCLIAIADGVGGNRAGDVAADFVVSHLQQKKDVTKQDIALINDELMSLSFSQEKYHNMATTLTGISFYQKRCMFHVGNTRIYIMQGSYLKQITEDHTTVNWLLKTGKMSESEAKIYDKRNEITACMGGGNKSLINQLHFDAECKQIENAHIIVLTSDGIHEYISTDDFEDLLNRNCSKNESIYAILNRAEQNNSIDDKSIIIIEK